MIQGRVFQSVREMKLRLGGLQLQSLYSVCVAWLVIGMAKAAVAQTKVRRPGCLGECGGVIIPYPFGIVGPGLEDCYIPGFNVSCEDGVPRLLGLPDSNNFTLSQIQIPDHLVHLQSSNITAIDCVNSTTQNNHRTTSVNISLGGRFTISSQRNKFKAFGCNATATITAGSSLVGRCEEPGQCKIALPDRSYSFSYNVSNRVDYSKSSCSTPCSFAILVEESFLANYSYFSSQTSPANVSSMPLVAEWEIQDGLCNRSSGWSPACGQNAFCSYSSGTGSSSGYRCVCTYCKKGNPYLNGTAGCAGLIKKRSKKQILLVIMAGGIFLLGTLVYCLWRNLLKGKGSPRINKSSNATIFEDNERKDLDIPFFEFESILTATDNFSEANKLGQGGFGSVYKGKLTAGQEVAVKRLSKGSKQGQEEFKNEATVIAKLQHKNLVRLLGYSTKGDERLLLYEYMPNKSLDRLLFDSNGCKLLSWDKRYNIILGIARGLVYLHEDSRLRIIHRDLKTSNVLLNEELEPKISDFGMARIFGGNQIQENTKRVVGTYGYMAPEYASHGIFSVKSDVFSFGVILLEIVSGKKNTLFYLSDQSTNLLTHAWELWKEGKWMDVIDRNLIEECNMFEAEKCIRIGLLCVQENILDRPTMATVVGMFVSGQTQTLPPPKQPALITTTPSHPNSSPASINDVTISTIECR